jgi:hypothetical protein
MNGLKGWIKVLKGGYVGSVEVVSSREGGTARYTRNRPRCLE